MKVTLAAALVCECGSVMMVAERPYSHLAHCCNPNCEHCGVFVVIPRFEVKPGKAYRDGG